MSRLRSPVRWFGGKGKMVAKILPILTAIPHTRYVEPFGGGASILMAKPPVDVETYNDIDNGLYDLFTVLSDPDEFEQFYRRVSVLPCSRQLYNDCCAKWRDEPDKIKRVVMWYVIARQSFSGRFEAGWGSAVTATTRGMASTASNWLSAIDRLPDIHQRLARVQIENADWRDILRRYDTPETLFYLDPPYVSSTRRGERYAHELADNDHAELVEMLLNLKGHAALSGYPNAIYQPFEDAGWKRTDWQTACHAAGRTRNSNLQGDGAALKHQPRVESVWISPRVPRQLELI